MMLLNGVSRSTFFYTYSIFDWFH